MGKRQKKITKVDSLENSEEEETQILGEEEDAQPDRNGRKQFTNFAKYNVASEMESLELEVYSLNFPMFAKPIIFHNKYFSNKFEGAYVPATRKGSSTDVKALVHMFMNHLNCLHPIVHKDKSAAEIKAIIKDASQDDYSDVACLIIVVLTHGEENELYSYDKKYETSSIWKPFTDKYLKNPTLSGKPKLFFIQACRGDMLDIAIDVVDAKPSNDVARVQRKIPHCANFFISYSSFPGEKQIPCTETTLTKLLFLHNEAVSNMHLSKNVQSKSINQKSIDITDSQSLPNPVNSNVLDGKYISHPLFYQHYKIVVLGCAIAVLGGIFITWFKSISGNCQCH